MNYPRLRLILAIICIPGLLGVGTLLSQAPSGTPPRRLPETPLPQETLDCLANEISGQMIFNNEVKLAGAPWLREESELKEAFFESEGIAALAKGYGVEDVRIHRLPRDSEFQYALHGEFWILQPEKKLIARLEADPAMIAGVPEELDLTADLIYIPPLSQEQIKEWTEAGPQDQYRGKVALMWSHARQDAAKALDAAGVVGVVSFSSRERYFDPDQVVYSRGSYRDLENLLFGFTISWRQWSELLEDVERGIAVKVRCAAKSAAFPDRFENVLCRIPGTEPDRKGVLFTAHLFEGYTKRGANDNMSGCVIQLEILRALTKLIRDGALPRPRRTIAFLWPNEISGTYEQIKQTPGWMDRLSININMDMVGEGLRKNNAMFTMSECPNHLPSYLDGLADSVMNYVWRTNDIVYLPDSPRGRPGGQYFPLPLWEKNGSLDAFRYFTHIATGGSDHTCFNNPSVAVPAIEFFTWPDQWYHADTDTPDKSDPTQMKRVAFIGAAVAWAAANCTDDVLEGLLKTVSAFGYARIGKRDLPRALEAIGAADRKDLQKALDEALNLVSFSVTREAGAVGSVEDIYSGSKKAQEVLALHLKQWDLYGASLENQIRQVAAFRAAQLNLSPPAPTPPAQEEKPYTRLIPDLHPDVRAKEFSLERSEMYGKYVEAHPDALKDLKLSSSQRRSILNFINGRLPLTTIRKWAGAETGTTISFEAFLRYIRFLEAVGWIQMKEGIPLP